MYRARQHHRNRVLRTSFRAFRLQAAGGRVTVSELERFTRTRERAVLRRVVRSLQDATNNRELRSVLRDFNRENRGRRRRRRSDLADAENAILSGGNHFFILTKTRFHFCIHFFFFT